jgi:hypothetical protein
MCLARHMRHALAPILIVSTAFMQLAKAGPIRLVDTKVVEDDPSRPYVLMHIATGNDSLDSDNPAGAHVWIRKPAGQQGEPFLSNRDGTIAVLNIRPATKWRLVYLLLSFDGGELNLIPNFSERLARLCRTQHKEIADREIWVDSIDGDVLTVGSREYAHSLYTLKVRVAHDGSLTLLDYKRESLEPLR